MATQFDKLNFARILRLAKGTRSINQYGFQSGVDPGYISKLLRELVEYAPLPPTIKKLAAKAYNGVTYQELMQAAGHLEEESPAKPIESDNLVKIPVYGAIRVKEPLFVSENIEAYEYLPSEEASQGESFYLKVTDDSMVNARIYPGDLVYVQKQSNVEDGEIAVVLLGGMVTLKRIYRAGGKIILQPENPNYKPQVTARGEAIIVGKVLHVKFDAK